MAYVPGFEFDVFVSYAHGDDQEWIKEFIGKLTTEVRRRLGRDPAVWIDNEDLRKSRDFSREIPESVRSSAVFLLLPSPSYIRSAYCVEQECRVFAETLAARRARFAVPVFANDLFALRCPILPVDGNEHWTLFSGLTDIPFCADSGTFAIASAEFEKSHARLVGELVDLLKRMRNHSTPVFLYPPTPPPDVAEAHKALLAELTAQSYRVVPDRQVNLAEQLRASSLAVFLLGNSYDEHAAELVDIAAGDPGKPWIVWGASAANSADANQIGLCAYVEQIESANKVYLNAATLPAKLKEEVLAVLKPPARQQPATGGKPSVYLVYNARDASEKRNASLISYTFRKEFFFEHPDDPALHTRRLADSDGVLLVWGSADEEWCSREFLEIVQSARRHDARGLCLFDPRETKDAAVAEIRRTFGDDVFVGEQFGRFDPSRLDSFFTPIRRRQQGGGQ